MKALWSKLNKPLFWMISPLILLLLLAWLFRKRALMQKAKAVVSTTVNTVVDKADSLSPTL